LSQLADPSSQIKLGVLAVSPFGMLPLKIADSLLTLNEVSHGRAPVAVGAGAGNLTAMILDTPTKIVLAVREALAILLPACSDDLKKGYRGALFSVALPRIMDGLNMISPVVYGTAL
jgi:Coenzyme F420-dependent N5,N10-methylene tetrahydromethanopterin reductase and related flavin-dependent oxidoreductases